MLVESSLDYINSIGVWRRGQLLPMVIDHHGVLLLLLLLLLLGLLLVHASLSDDLFVTNSMSNLMAQRVVTDG